MTNIVNNLLIAVFIFSIIIGIVFSWVTTVFGADKTRYHNNRFPIWRLILYFLEFMVSLIFFVALHGLFFIAIDDALDGNIRDVVMLIGIILYFAFYLSLFNYFLKSRVTDKLSRMVSFLKKDLHALVYFILGIIVTVFLGFFFNFFG